MKDNIISLVKPHPKLQENDELQEDMIMELERLLDRAKNGEIVGISFITELPENQSPNVLETGHYIRSAFKVLGGVYILQRELSDLID